MPDYIDPPIVTDPDDLAAIGFAFIQSIFPNWVPVAGALDTISIEANARVAAVVANLAAAMPKAAFRFLGALYRILPINATPASVGSTWTARDDSGYTILAGTTVGIAAAGDVQVPFTVAADVTIPPGETTTGAGAVQLVAVTSGAAGSGLGGNGIAAALIDIVDFISSVTLTGITTNGVDAEADDVYLSRLSDELLLQSPRPILPPDFAALAKTVPTVDRALAIDMYQPAVNERQTITVDATGGTFTLTFNTHVTSALAHDASAATVQAALEALTGVGAGQVACTGGPLNDGPITVEFIGSLGGTDVSAMTANSASLTGGGHTASIATIQTGAAAIDDQERTVTVVPINSAGASTAINDVRTLLQSLRESTFVVPVIAPTYTTIGVSFEIGIGSSFTDDDVITRAEAAVAAFLSPANWGLPTSGDQRGWIDSPIVRILDVAGVLRTVEGVAFVSSVQLSKNGGSLGDDDITMDGPAALPNVGTVAGAAA